jgi:hypothetical protein
MITLKILDPKLSGASDCLMLEVHVLSVLVLLVEANLKAQKCSNL